MQKKIIALAVAGLASTAAFAQTNVTIYGVADAGVFYASNSNGRNALAVQSGVLGGSRLGFKGTEDLGNGLKANFVLEQGFSLDTGDAGASSTGGSTAFQRQAWVGLSSKGGDVSLGRQYAPGYGASVRADAFAGSLISPLQTMAAAAGTTIAVNSNARWNNSVRYATPTMGGFSAEAIYRAGESSQSMNSNEGYGIGLRYAAGPANVDFVYQNTDASAQGTGAFWTGNVSAGSEQAYFLGGSFDLKVVKLTASVQMADWGGKQLQTNSDTQVYSAGAVVPVGRGNVHAGMAYLDMNGKRATVGAAGQGWSYALAYTHGLSKRTTLYTAINYTDLAGLSRTQGYTATSATAVAANQNTANLVNGGGNGTTFGVGINHTF